MRKMSLLSRRLIRRGGSLLAFYASDNSLIHLLANDRGRVTDSQTQIP